MAQMDNNMLSWLIPQQLKQDIRSTMAGPREFGRGLYHKLREEYKSSHDDDNWSFEDWERRVIDAFGQDAYNVFKDSTDGLEGMDSLSLEEYQLITDAGERNYQESMANFNPLDQESLFSSLAGVGPHYQYGAYGSGDPETGGALLQELTTLKEGTTPLTVGGLRKIHTGYYNPFIESKRDPLEKQYGTKRATARAAGGDFAGYGQRQKLEDVSEGSFLTGVENIYADVDKYRQSATQNILDTIGQWEEMSEAYMG
jgi:hypothetical protein